MKLPTELVFARELQPFFYSDETAPAITVKTMHGIVHAAAYKTVDGKVKVRVTGNGQGADCSGGLRQVAFTLRQNRTARRRQVPF